MTATGHALVGTLIAARFTNPLIAFPLSLASHFVLDIVPHWDSGTHWREKTKNRLLYESIFDVTVSILASLFLYKIILGQSNYEYLFINIFLSQLPDWLMGPYLILKINNPVFKYAYILGKKTNKMLDKPWGIVTQVAAVIITYLLLFRIPFIV